jgi:transcriptional regulator with XRE-family HTH domain
MSDIRQVLASNMKLHRKKLGYSQAKLAEKTGTATNYIAAIEASRRFPSINMLEKISDALEIESSELFSTQNEQITSINELQTDLLQEIQGLISTCIAQKLEKLKAAGLEPASLIKNKASCAAACPILPHQ